MLQISKYEYSSRFDFVTFIDIISFYTTNLNEVRFFTHLSFSFLKMLILYCFFMYFINLNEVIPFFINKKENTIRLTFYDKTMSKPL